MSKRKNPEEYNISSDASSDNNELKKSKNDKNISKKEKKIRVNEIFPHSKIKSVCNYFPINTNVIDYDDKELWDLICKHSRPYFILFRCKHFHIKLFNSIKTVEPIDIRFAAILQVGNLAYRHKEIGALKETQKYLKEMIDNLPPNIVLTGLKNHIQSYCTIENEKYVPNYINCDKNMGALYILMRLAKKIKGGDESLRKEMIEMCLSIWDVMLDIKRKKTMKYIEFLKRMNKEKLNKQNRSFLFAFLFSRLS